MKVFSNFIWRFAERCGAQLVTFIVSIVLARILTPSDYGTIALVTVFTTILQVFIDSGLSTALIQKKDADDLDFSSVFYFNFVICIILYLIMFVSAPFIADFYKDSSLVSVIGFEELTRRGQLIIAKTYASFEIWGTVAVIYLIMTVTISQLVGYLERKYSIK